MISVCKFGKQELVPIVIGGMGVDISTADLALEAARLGGIGHISDAMVNTVTDRRFNTKFVKDKLKQYKFNVANPTSRWSSSTSASLPRRRACTSAAPWSQARRRPDLRQLHGKADHERAAETLRVRLEAALDAASTASPWRPACTWVRFALIEDHPRFRDAKLGIIVSSLRALQLFLQENARTNRLPDYIVVEGTAGRRASRFRHGLGASTTWRRSSPKSPVPARPRSSTFR
jgi:nitronate monooxygenase